MTPEVNVDVKQESVEVLDPNGKNLNRSGALSDIFDKIQSGKPADEAIQEVMVPDKKEEVKSETKPEVKKTEPVVEKKEEKPAPVEKSDDPREALRKSLETTQEAKQEVKPVEKTTDEVPEDELQVLPYDKPKTAKRIQALLKRIDAVQATATETKKEADARAARLAELEGELSKVKTANPTVDEAVKKQLDELAMFRRQYELDKDPEVKSKFDDRIQDAEKQIPGILSRHGAGEGLIKIIQEEGGWLKFSQSNRPIQLKDEMRPASEVAELILQALPFAERRSLEAIALEQISTQRERERFFQEKKKEAVDYFKKREEETVKRTADQQKYVDDAKKFIEEWQRKTLLETEWLKEKQPPANATPDQKAAVDEENRYTQQLVGLLNKAVSTKDIPGMLEVVKDSVQYYQERRAHAKTLSRVKSLESELAAKQAEIDKFKKGASSTTRAGSIAGGGSASAAPAKAKKPDNLEDAFAIIEKHGSIDGDRDE